MPSDSQADSILLEWAEVERILNNAKDRLDGMARQSSEAALLRVEIARLIEEWARLWNRYRELIGDAPDSACPALPAP
jgi:hypothetical protein